MVQCYQQIKELWKSVLAFIQLETLNESIYSEDFRKGVTK
jgi:hypothetical protein